MTSILSAISGHFSKALILGTFLPVVLFVVLGVVFVVPLFPPDVALPKTLEALAAEWKLVVVTLTAVVLTALLYNLNVPLIKLYEGYPWQESWLGRRRARSYQLKVEGAQARWKGMRTLLRALPEDDARRPKILAHWNEIGRRMNREFPLESKVLPTRLGNVIRSFEDYPKRQYHISAIPVWPRLIAKIDKDYAAATDDAKTSFDFMINCSALSATLALLILFVGLLYPAGLGPASAWGWWLSGVVLFCFLYYLAYLGAVDAASAWGDMVKGSFDLYRWELLKQFGFRELPATSDEERELWKNISQRMVFGDTPTVPPAVYEPSKQASRPAEVRSARGVGRPQADGSVEVTLRVTNVDAERREATNVVVTDSAPAGFDYEWNSAGVVGGSRPLEVSGLNPYHFHVGTLTCGETVTITYRAVRLEG